MGRAENTELLNSIKAFYQTRYAKEIEELARNYPGQRSLYIDWDDIDEYDPDMAYDFQTQPEILLPHAEKALQIYDLPTDDTLLQPNVRITNPPTIVTPSNLQTQHTNTLVAVEGVVVEASDAQTHIQEAAFECQRCGTLSFLEQGIGTLQEPRECQGCERQGPFHVNSDQSEFVNIQELVVHDAPGTTDTTVTDLPIQLEDDLAGAATEHERVLVTGVPYLEQNGQGADSTQFDIGFKGLSIESQGPAGWEDWETYLDDSCADAEPTTDALDTFIARSRQILDQGPAMDEFETQTKIVTPFLHALGWNVYAPEVRVEYPRDDATFDDRADYVLFRDETPTAAVEAKRAGRPLRSGIQQAKRYMRLIGTDWGLATNGERYVVLRSDPDSEEPVEQIVLDVELEELVQHQERLAAVAPTESTDIEDWSDATSDSSESADRLESELNWDQDFKRRNVLDRVKEMVGELATEEDGVPHDELVAACMEKFDVEEDVAAAVVDQSKQKGEIYRINDEYRPIG